ncbi:MAG: hypothetical protein ABI112_07995 [Terracoccus sp.]
MTRMIGRWWPTALVALAAMVFLFGELVASRLIGVLAAVLLFVYA